MPTQVYESETIFTMDGQEVYLTPLKLKYLRMVMDKFDDMSTVKNDIDAISVLAECALIGMKQYLPEVTTIEELEDRFDMDAIYRIIDIGAGIKINKDPAVEPVKQQATKSSENSWADLDLAKLESELFLLGIWKDYEELETSLSMPEVSATLNAKRDMDYLDKRFTAALQGVDLDEQLGKKEDDPWEAMKARVAAKTSGIAVVDANDITSFQGTKARQNGFGIGMGLSYEKLEE
jgi:hypothetical protein